MNTARRCLALIVLQLAGCDQGSIGTSSGPTIVEGGIVANQTWTKVGSPYIVRGDITVPAGASLDIEPGTTVKIASTDGTAGGLDASRIEVTILGELTIDGTSANPVTFEAETAVGSGSWYGIMLGSATTPAVVQHAAVRAAYYGLYCGETGALNLSFAEISDCNYGIVVGAPGQVIDAVTITETNDAAIYLVHGCGITNCVIRDNYYGILAELATNGDDGLAVVNCTIDGNDSSGLLVKAAVSGYGYTVNVANSIVTNNAAFGVARQPDPGTCHVYVTYSDLWNNGTNHTADIFPSSSLSADPLFVDPALDLGLQAGSPCVDTGTNTGAPDHDRVGAARPQNGGIGELSDMGAYERSP